MKNINKLVAGFLVVAMLGSVAVAGDKKKAPKCSACGMTLATKKSKANSVAVKIKGKTYYCCAGCKMDAPKSKSTKTK